MIIIVVGGTHPKQALDNFNEKLQFSEFIGFKDYDFIDWLKTLTDFKNNNVIINGAWLTDRIENNDRALSDNEVSILYQVMLSLGGFVVFNDYDTDYDSQKELQFVSMFIPVLPFKV